MFIPTTYISELALRKYIPGCGEERSTNNMTNKWNQLVDRINHAAGRRAMVEDQVGRPRKEAGIKEMQVERLNQEDLAKQSLLIIIPRQEELGTRVKQL
ncbi:hypothetical protein F2Q69_00013073 [Brassica cretica]|uniref:Uncharacterized protein n=1 Tax=Brassica cretica TaxID=69181 RepID=A0A8S9QNL4_BRACR|nr:hypothetical protein F2Q69_00013073 [Brassica cretica]